MRISARPRRHQLGQSIVEMAIATPVLLALILGAFDVAVMISDKVIAGNACRQGARLAAEIGGKATNPGLSWAQADQNIVQNVLAVATAMNYSQIQFIYIYSPTQPNGDLNTATDQYDKFNSSGTSVFASFNFANRLQVPPNETPIGVRLEWQYKPPTGFASFTINLSEHAVFMAAPVLP
jgi:Flp pilus assembly protein TadG